MHTENKIAKFKYKCVLILNLYFLYIKRVFANKKNIINNF